MSKNNSDFFKTKNTWSVVKDNLLRCYLHPYFQKLLITGKPIFYVDCFAGKGKFDDGESGSPLIALEIREKCLALTSRKDKSNAIQTCFIELNHAGALRGNIESATVSYNLPEIIHGKYEDNIERLLKDKKDYNVFLYIDPYGIRALDSTLFEKFRTYEFNTFEMLINFNSFGFFRDACRVMNVDYSSDEALKELDDLVEYAPTVVSSDKQSEALLTNIAGGEYWKDIVSEYKCGKISGYHAEKKLSTGYRNYLKKYYKYVLDMPIRLKADQRPKYRMIHVCNHEDGCFLMAQNMQKRKDELFTNIQRQGQLSLFDDGTTFASTLDGETITFAEVAERVWDCFSLCPCPVNVTEFLATFVNENGLICDFRMIYDILSDFESKGDVKISRNPPITISGRKSSFWEESRNQHVILRRTKK